MSSSTAAPPFDSSTLSSLDILKLYSSGGLYLDESNLYLSEDGKELFFLGGGSSTLPVATRNATEENVLESYTLASIYLLCIYPSDLRSYRKSCDRANCTAVKTTDKPKILTILLGEEYYNKVLQQQQPIESTSTSNRDRKKHEAESNKKDHRDKPPHQRSHKKQHHRDHGTTTSSSRHKTSSSHKEVTTSTNKRIKTSSTLSKDQVLENLTLVVDKKWEKKYQLQQPMEEETPMKGDSEDQVPFQTPKNAMNIPSTYMASSTTSIAAATPASAVVMINEEEELKKTKQLRELLADKSSIVTDDELLANDLQKTNVITSMEIPVGDSLSILRAPGRDLSRVLEMYNEAMKQQQQLLQQQKRKGSSKLSSSSLKATDAAKDSNSKGNTSTTDAPLKPIIIVPNTMTSPITLLNAVEFLAQGKYVSREAILKQRSANASASSMPYNTAETPKQQPYTFTRKVPSMYLSSSGGMVPKGTGSNPSNSTSATSNNNQVEYEIIDNPRKYLRSRQDWDRIVAVVALGASWQFKDWPGKFQIPVELFNKVKGYYFGIQENTTIPKEVQGWNMQTILLARNNRSADGIAHAKFWNTLDEWMSIHKPELLPSSMDA